jgi:cold shock CspA family protein
MINQINFGIVKDYLPNKGFGFISHPACCIPNILYDKKSRHKIQQTQKDNLEKISQLDGIQPLTYVYYLGPNTDVFFHIKNIEKNNQILAESLSNFRKGINICFWYIPEQTAKGTQLKKIIDPKDVFEINYQNNSIIKVKLMFLWESFIKNTWLDAKNDTPFWLTELTKGLLGEIKLKEFQNQRNILLQEREILINAKKEKLKIEEEKSRILREKKANDRIIEREERQKRIQLEIKARKRNREIKSEIEKIQNEEFELLVSEIKAKGFKMSAQVSNYIIKNRLGDKYQNISGVLELKNNNSSWKFNGGFPPEIYAKLCERLNLGNKKTDARVIGFTSFKNLKKE